MTGDYWPYSWPWTTAPNAYPYWSVIPPYPMWYYGPAIPAQTTDSANENPKRRRYRRIK